MKACPFSNTLFLLTADVKVWQIPLLKRQTPGYLTRRRVDVPQEAIIIERKIAAKTATFRVSTSSLSTKAIPLSKALRTVSRRQICGNLTVCDPDSGEILAPKNEMITLDQAKKIDAKYMEWLKIEGEKKPFPVKIRSVLTCKCKHGVCVKCYGKDMSGRSPVRVGEAVGIIAAQSIGEPGTQLTMRTFHSGGVAAADDITRGLPRVEELFEARKPKGVATITHEGGKIELVEKDGRRFVTVHTHEGKDVNYSIPFGAKLKANINTGATVNLGDPLTEGPIDPHDILKTKGHKEVQEYIVKEVQAVYRGQGVDIADKHIEIIVHKMLKKVRVENSGDTLLLPGEMVDSNAFNEANLETIQKGGRPAMGKFTLLGITKAALATDSFLSAASFQETARVLTEAAIKNKVDPLIGLKENVIIGKLIPAGTGMSKV